MAEFGFVLSKREEEALVRAALDSGAWLVPDVDYKTPEAARISTYTEYEGYRGSTRMFLIVHPSYFAAPLEMKETSKEGKCVYFIMQRNGGPTIEFMSSVEFREAGRAKINPGFLAHHKTFWNPKTHRNEDMPAALLKLYRELSSIAKKIATRQKVGMRTYWIGNVVKDLIEAGKLCLGIDHSTAR